MNALPITSLFLIFQDTDIGNILPFVASMTRPNNFFSGKNIAIILTG